MALAVAPSSSHTALFGNNFQFDSTRKPSRVTQDIILQYSAISQEVLELYGLHNYIHKKMRKKETAQHAKHLARGFRSHGDPMYQQYRSVTVDWMCQVGEACNLGNLTIHTAIGFMDMFLDVIPIDGSRLQLVGAATILIAAKIEELEEKVPRVSTLHAYCVATLTPPAFIPKVESLILNHLNWEMVVVTPLHFLDYYLLVCLSPCELLSNPHLRDFGETKEYIAKMAEFLVDLCEHHSLYREYLPSIVAAAAIGTARQMLKVTPVWPQSLQLITSHTLLDISQCMANIWGHYRQSFAPLA